MPLERSRYPAEKRRVSRVDRDLEILIYVLWSKEVLGIASRGKERRNSFFVAQRTPLSLKSLGIGNLRRLGGTCIQICPIGVALLSCPVIRPRTCTTNYGSVLPCHNLPCRYLPRRVKLPRPYRARETVPRADTEQDLVSLARAAIAASDTSVPLAAMDMGLFLGVARRWSLLL